MLLFLQTDEHPHWWSLEMNQIWTFWHNKIGAEKNEPTWLYSALIKKKIHVRS